MSGSQLQPLTDAVVALDEQEARRRVEEALEKGTPPLEVLDAARAAMEEIGARFERGEAFLPELVAAGDIMTRVAEIVTPRLEARALSDRTPIVLGTVRGDIHDIGKNIVATLLGAAGHEVIDLGVDVPAERFVAAATDSGAAIIGLSCLLTVGFASMKETVAALRDAVPNGGLRVMIGGGAVDEGVCRYVGADGWGADAPSAVTLADAWAEDSRGDARVPDHAAPRSGAATDEGGVAAPAAPREASPASSAEEPDAQARAEQTPDERFAARFEAWQEASHLEFVSPEAAERYRRHCRWLRDTLELKGTVVPVAGTFLHYPYRQRNVRVRTAMYDYDVLADTILKFHREHMPDVISADPLLPGRVFDILDCRQWAWPGHGVDDDGAFQWVEGAYMEADEYESLLDDPTRFWLTRYLPRVFPVLAPLAGLPPLTDIDSAAVTSVLGTLAGDDAMAMFEALREGAAASVAYDEGWATAYDTVSATLGLPAWLGGIAISPYDFLANELRGARNTMLDIVHRRDLVKAAVERLTPLTIDKAVRSADAIGVPIVLIPLHWGSDGFMSETDYRELYWPSLEALIRGCIDAGTVPLLWTEADYSSRLPIIAAANLPAGRTIWGFEDTPMKLAREIIGDRCAISGNFPVSLLEVGDEAQVRATVRRLFDDAAGDGNFIFNIGASTDEGKPQNVHAMLDEAKRLSRRDDER